MRRYIDLNYEKDRDILELMHVLSSPISSEESYRNSFYGLGKALGASLNLYTQNSYGKTMLACASEDADWLARGVLESLSQKQVSLAVFWNERITLDEINKVEYSPIIKSYINQYRATAGWYCAPPPRPARRCCVRPPPAPPP